MHRAIRSIARMRVLVAPGRTKRPEGEGADVQKHDRQREHVPMTVAPSHVPVPDRDGPSDELSSELRDRERSMRPHGGDGGAHAKTHVRVAHHFHELRELGGAERQRHVLQPHVYASIGALVHGPFRRLESAWWPDSCGSLMTGSLLVPAGER